MQVNRSLGDRGSQYASFLTISTEIREQTAAITLKRCLIAARNDIFIAGDRGQDGDEGR